MFDTRQERATAAGGVVGWVTQAHELTTTAWRVAIARTDEVPVGDDWLAPAERAACARLATPAARDDYRASRLAARRAVAQLDLAPAGRSFTLSLTHRLGRGAAAATAVPGVRVGVDLELAGSVAPDRARYFLTPRERDAAAAAGRRDLAALWALKEAAWKALAVHETVCFSALELSLDAGRVTAVALLGTRYAATSALSAPWPGWVLAVVGIAAGAGQ